MATYTYKAVTRTGQVMKSKISDTSKQNVIIRLKNNGLTPIIVEKKKTINIPGQQAKERRNKATSVPIMTPGMMKKFEEEQKPKLQRKVSFDFLKFERIKPEDIISFTQSLFLLKKANFTNLRAMTTLFQNTTNKAMKDVIEDILNGVEAGEYIYTTMEYYSKYFPDIYVNIIKVGELSGSLTNALDQAMRYLEESRKIKRDVKKALTGPLMQSGFLISMSVICLIVGLPIMKDLYGQLGVEDQIPAATLAAADFMSMLGTYWYLVLAGIAGLVFGFIFWKGTPSGRYVWDKFKITMPIFGGLILRLHLQKIFKALQLNLANNARLQDALEVSKNVTNNYVLLSILETAISNLQVGESWIEPFERMKGFPPMALEMLRIGMETDMVEMINKIVEFIEQDIQITMAKIIKVLPEVSNVVMGIILIGFVMIILKPIMEVYLGSFLFDAYGL